MRRKILIIDDHDDLATALNEDFSKQGFHVEIAESRKEAAQKSDETAFDVIITDLDGSHLFTSDAIVSHEGPDECISEDEDVSNVKSFRICLANYRGTSFEDEEVEKIVKTTLNHKARFIDRGPAVKNRHELISFEVPSLISLMGDILNYLMKRVEKLGVIDPEQSNLFVALDEAFVNAVKHGNKFDSGKLVRVTVDISPDRASFTIEDEGDGFDVEAIPDPTNPENLFKTSGRGVMFIYNIMDEVSYNQRGNRLTMVKLNDNGSNSDATIES